MRFYEIINEEYKGPLSDKQKELLKKGYKLDKDGVPYWEPDGGKLSPYYNDDPNDDWNEPDEWDKEFDALANQPDIDTRDGEKRRTRQTSWDKNVTTGFSGGGSTTRHGAERGYDPETGKSYYKPSYTTRQPGINAKISTTTSKRPNKKPTTKTTFKGNL